MIDNVKNIIFDFDGVILDSMSVRAEGFRTIFEGSDESALEKFLTYHRKNGGISRFVKIRYFYEELLGKSISDEAVASLALQFKAIMQKELVKPGYLINETVEFIKYNHEKYPLHIASGAEEGELRFLCETHGLTPYFLSIHGSPTKKPLIVANIMENYGYATSETVLIGDSINDYAAARDNHIKFLGYNENDLRNKGDGYIESFKEL